MRKEQIANRGDEEEEIIGKQQRGDSGEGEKKRMGIKRGKSK